MEELYRSNNTNRLDSNIATKYRCISAWPPVNHGRTKISEAETIDKERVD
jgi:hypothetical protein